MRSWVGSGGCSGSVGNELSEHDFRLKLMGNIIIKQDQKIKELESKIVVPTEKEMRANIIIHGLVEERELYSDLKDKVATFFNETMEIEQEIEILDAFCMGKKTTDQPVCVKLQHPRDKSLIFLNASNLKEKENVKRKLFSIQDNQTEQQAEVRRYYHDLLKDSKGKKDNPEKGYTVKMVHGDISLTTIK